MNSTIKQILDMVRARYPLIYLVSPEEARAEEHLDSLETATAHTRNIIVWSITEGFRGRTDDQLNKECDDPTEALNEILKWHADEESPCLFVLRDFHEYMQDPIVKRRIRDLARILKDHYKNVIFLSPVQEIPQELTFDIVVLDFDLPDRDEVNDAVDIAVNGATESGIDIDLEEEERNELVDACLGLDLVAIDGVLSRSLVELKRLDSQLVLREKEHIIKREGLLEFIQPTITIDDIGGLENLKRWLHKRRNAYTQEARDFCLPFPSGILLIGIPGTGKSLTAKCVGTLWNMPLLRLDIGRLFAGIVGASEENMRRAIRTMEAIAPCVVWVDEIDKGLSGSKSSGYTDGGTGARVFGSFITWMQEKTKPVFVIATANDVSALPPELLRKGRFDEIFALDLPTTTERERILEVHLTKRRRPAESFDLKKLAVVAEGLTGAEIEQAVVTSLFDAFDANTDIDSPLLATKLKGTMGIAQTMEEDISHLREWQKTRALHASLQEKEVAVGAKKGRKMELG